MSKTLEGMARAAWGADGWKYDIEAEWIKHSHQMRHRDALLWLADNVSDEMVMAYMTHKPRLSRDLTSAVRESISAALRAAAGGGE